MLMRGGGRHFPFLSYLLCHKYLWRWSRDEGNKQGDELHVWLSICLWPTGLISHSCHCCSVSVHWNSTSTFSVGDLPGGFLRAALWKKEITESPVCAPPPHPLNTSRFSCFYIAVFYHSGSFYFLWFLFHCTTCLFSSLSSVCEVGLQRWLFFSPTSESHCVFVTEGWSVCFSGLFCLLLCFTHTYPHTAISYSLLLCIYVGIL